MNVEGKLSKPLSSDSGTLVVKAVDRDTVLNEISARMARYERSNPVLYEELKDLRGSVRDIFNKGLPVGDDMMEQLYFLDPSTRELVEKMTRHYDRIVTPNDFQQIARIMSDHLAEMVPILKDFTGFFGRLAEDFLLNAKPKNADFDWKSIAKWSILGSPKRGYVLPDVLSRMLDIKPGTSVRQEVLQRLGLWSPGSNLDEIINGVRDSKSRRMGAKYTKFDILQLKDLVEVNMFHANKLPKSWTNVPWVNFDGKIIEQNFTGSFEQRLAYKDPDGNWHNNIIQVPNKTEATWWEQVINKSGKINDIADVQKARTAYGVNGNHSNDAVIVKRYHLWGKEKGIATSTIHDAFFANAADMLAGRQALREIYAEMLDVNVIQMILDEMRARGLPKEVYEKYLKEAYEKKLIGDTLKKEDILRPVPDQFEENQGWYGVG